MAKRFTDTAKWEKPWWRGLTMEAKVAWLYLCDNCDHAGVWHGDFALMSFQTGFEINEDMMGEYFGDKVLKVDDDKYFIPSFIEFQYGELRDNNAVHQSAIKTLTRLGVKINVQSGYSTRPSAIASRLSFKMKRELFAEDFYTCGYCGLHGDDKTLTVDHIVPRVRGGDNDPENLITACVSCNSKKTDMELDKFIDKNNFAASLSENIKLKIGVNKKLNGAFKDLYSPKDKEEEEDKEKVKEEDKEKEECKPLNRREMVNLIRRSVSKYGYSNLKEAKASMGPDVWGLVQAMGGWAALCRMPDNDYSWNNLIK